MSTIKPRGGRYHATPKPEDLQTDRYAEKADELPIMFDELSEFDEAGAEDLLRRMKGGGYASAED